MTTIIASPTRYIQGDNALAEIRRHVEPLGKKLLILASASGKARVENLVAESLAGSACSAHY